ncbi:hypothetical protein AAZX31_08G034300 [Glycine max]|uniref:Avr9/Cf-9 rapidly elicited protein 146 n=2 Tax=Glycine subgen. Soja TaxID=1462606 RepID=I1KPX6_SOYBN|nr:uncharacterized protein LOC100305871 [Glycine max]XP_028244038.1 uncharacterized protein LOC114422054 [Glycine soja]KAH1049452.1 hypothetical protein GYH30_020124 [Glycine max]KAH1235901.1 hypothetical protein GmHk_08G021248 [Glycine max]KHN16635.1 hypothetical protein glysoja_002732 [Glycine soja]KRH41509.1 hypothetical protein GLYMA_08G034400v4 [Glycine max]RZB95064.1 hypothetical protein D0Y65_019500 [Glycine soja]|eukprot:NP_001237978.2 uncharacterized protein LOC100305871 [Glycine max]
MEIEASRPVVAKKVWNMVRVLFFMLRKGIAKSKIMVEFHLMLKRGKLALNNLILNHHYYNMQTSFFTCRSHHHSTFISPSDYEFSCSNSPAIPTKRTNRFSTKSLSSVQKVLEILNNENNINSPFPGFGKSPASVRQLRVTDSPFPLKDEEDSQVDVAAEEFIKNFYKDLNLQKKMAYLDSPYHISWNR